MIEDETADMIRENSRYAVWERLRCAARDVLHCLDTPRPDLADWIGRFDDAQARASAAAAEIGLPYTPTRNGGGPR